MPTYEYACRTCGARFEAWQKITDDPIETCPTCGNPVHRVLYPVGLVFKGGGFYKTDSRGTAAAAEPAGEVKAGAEAATGETAAKDGAAKSTAPTAGDASEAKSKPAADKPVAAASGE
jgi:putative FmdB family regulatory protein